ncbi:hypothetical protein BX600DRAFT_466691 [Xylariales sp. PMI_506]|nr:hypothetical protein BX600DRAFT_466691 [Xylariales sp. PMI_506]
MDPAWEIPDIICSVLEHLAPRDLARLARTCRALNHWAIHELWQSLDSFVPFLSCLPRSYKTKPLSRADLERLDFYASRVHHLVLESEDPQKKTFHVPKGFYAHQWKTSTKKTWQGLWEEISALRPTSEFLPNLQRLRLRNVDHQLLVPLIGISGENLTQVYMKQINGKNSDDTVRAILKGFKNVTKLEYLFIRDGAELVPDKVIEDAPLKHLRLDPRFRQARHHNYHNREIPPRLDILQKSSLEQLTLCISQNWFSPESIAAIGTSYLPALKSLWLDLELWAKEDNVQFRGSWAVRTATKNWGWDLPECLEEADRVQEANKLVTMRRKLSPATFFERLDKPELRVLHIKFPTKTSGSTFLDVVSAATRNCRLEYLTDLALVGVVCSPECGFCLGQSVPLITPAELRAGLKMFLPLPHLKKLRISTAPNFLDELDLELYKSLADQVPILETLWLGHYSFVNGVWPGKLTYYEKTPLAHLAAFCHFLPGLVDVSIGIGNLDAIEERPNEEWACPHIKTLRISSWGGDSVVPRKTLEERINRTISTYFPRAQQL